MKRVRKKLTEIDWEEVNKDYNNGMSFGQIYSKYRFSEKLLKKAEKNNLLKINRRNLSESIKVYYQNNPDKHPWKNSDKFKSEPCELFKEKLRENNISFLEEYTVLTNRLFSVDIAFPDKKIGIEINGNQHYNVDGSLKKYYQIRHDLIVEAGWQLFEYQYKIVYNNELISEIINNLKNDFDLKEVDYTFYIKPIIVVPKKEPIIKTKKIKTKKINIKPVKIKKITKKELRSICKCGNKKNYYSKNCMECWLKNNKKVKNRPPIEQLLKEVGELGYSATGRRYGVSDNAIRKWLKVT